MRRRASLSIQEAYYCRMARFEAFAQVIDVYKFIRPLMVWRQLFLVAYRVSMAVNLPLYPV